MPEANAGMGTTEISRKVALQAAGPLFEGAAAAVILAHTLDSVHPLIYYRLRDKVTLQVVSKLLDVGLSLVEQSIKMHPVDQADRSKQQAQAGTAVFAPHGMPDPEPELRSSAQILGEISLDFMLIRLLPAGKCHSQISGNLVVVKELLTCGKAVLAEAIKPT